MATCQYSLWTPGALTRPRSRSSRTKQSTWLLCQSTRSLHRLVDDLSIDSIWRISDWLARLGAILIITFCSCTVESRTLYMAVNFEVTSSNTFQDIQKQTTTAAADIDYSVTQKHLKWHLWANNLQCRTFLWILFGIAGKWKLLNQTADDGLIKESFIPYRWSM